MQGYIALNFSCADDFWRRTNIIVHSSWISVSIQFNKIATLLFCVTGHSKSEYGFYCDNVFKLLSRDLRKAFFLVLKTGSTWLYELCFNHFWTSNILPFVHICLWLNTDLSWLDYSECRSYHISWISLSDIIISELEKLFIDIKSIWNLC